MSEKASEFQYTRVMIVDDHPLIRQGLGVFLKTQKDIVLVGEAASGEEAVRLCTSLQPDLVLMDIMMPNMDGITATQAILKVCPKTQIIALTSYYDQKLVKAAFEAGATGYLLKDISGKELIEAIREARIGHPPLSSEAAKALISSVKPSEPVHSLTKREMQVLVLMAEGLNNKQISQKLFVSFSTVKAQVSSILSKLGVTSRTEAVSFALRNNMLM